MVAKTSLQEWLKKINSHWESLPEFKIPSGKLKHLAIICDGNRRAAQEKGLDPYFGHRAGVEVIRHISRAVHHWGLKTLTFWTWSTENWGREKKQVQYIMNLAARFLKDSQWRQEIIENKVHFVWLGRRDRVAMPIRQALESLEKETRNFSSMTINLAVDYGGQDEIARALAKMIDLAQEGKFNSQDILAHPSLIFDYLDTAGQPLPDLVIRTGTRKNELPHTSGFMPLQSAYACWQFLPDLFPDLTPAVVIGAIKEFLSYHRRLGK